MPLPSVLRVGAHDTHLLSLAPSCGKSAAAHVLLLPGNPGQAEFYAPFLRRLHGALGGRCSVAAVSHLGMDLRGLTPPGKAFTLQDQIDHKASILAHAPSLRGAPVFVLGHSIGAYMALHAVEKLEALSPPNPAGADASQRAEVAAVIIACMPFLQVDFDCAQQRLLRRVTSLYWLLAPLAAVLQYLPIRVRRWLVSLVGPDMESHAAEVAVSLFNPTAVLNSLHLGGLEFKTLAAPADWWLLRKMGQRFVAVCAPEDNWMPQKHYDAMLQEVPGVQAWMEEGQVHAFCCSTACSDALAEQVAGVIQSRLTHTRS